MAASSPLAAVSPGGRGETAGSSPLVAVRTWRPKRIGLDWQDDGSAAPRVRRAFFHSEWCVAWGSRRELGKRLSFARWALWAFSA